MNNLLCEFEPIEINPELLQCKYCSLIIQKRDSSKKYMCRERVEESAQNPDNNSHIRVKLVKSEILSSNNTQPTHTESADRQQCSQEQIDDRLSICNKCEFYQNNTCLQCGCALSRDRNFMNKLYWRDQSCPIGKWGTIESSD